MHPNTFYSTLFSQQKRDEVFVIMSFADEFSERWSRVFEPAISSDLGLKANRVDDRLSGESIMHDIMDGIAHSKLVLADITSTQMTDPAGQSWPQRNGNVMWELGIAQLMRLPDEVIIVKSDSDPSIFDLTQFRVFDFDPQQVFRAKKMIVEVMKDRLKSTGMAKSDYIARIAQSLTLEAWNYLLQAVKGPIAPLAIRTVGDALSKSSEYIAISRLMEVGAIRSLFQQVDPDNLEKLGGVGFEQLTRYEITGFGEELVKYSAQEQGLTRPDIQDRLLAYFKKLGFAT